MKLLEQSIEIAKKAHQGEYRRDGTLYIEHPLRVMKALADVGCSEEVQSVGVMHDVFENSKKFTFDGLLQGGFPADVIEALRLLTKQRLSSEQKALLTPEEKARRYQLYIQELIKSANTPAGQMAMPVKIEDIRDNYDNKNKQPLYDWALFQLGACSLNSSSFSECSESGLLVPSTV